MPVEFVWVNYKTWILDFVFDLCYLCFVTTNLKDQSVLWWKCSHFIPPENIFFPNLLLDLENAFKKTILKNECFSRKWRFNFRWLNNGNLKIIETASLDVGKSTATM